MMTPCLRRNGTVEEISLSDIVVGDKVLLTAGMSVPADGVMVSGEVYCNQSALTGEGKEIKKTPASFEIAAKKYFNTETQMNSHDSSLVLRGSTVISGNGEFIALRVGDLTLYGDVASELQEEAPESPLKRKLSVLAHQISIVGYIAAALVAFSYLFNVFFLENGLNFAVGFTKMKNVPYLLHELLSALTLAVSVLVVAVPEGLPMMITVVLSSNMKKMLKHKVLVKRMVGIETAGSMSLLFTDKTGTLTEGKMRVRKIVTTHREYSSLKSLRCEKCLWDHFKISAEYLPVTGTRNFTDCAISEYFSVEPSTSETIARIPFTSERRFSSVCLKDKTMGDVTYMRGAPETVLPFCSYFLGNDGEVSLLTNENLSKITEKWHGYASAGSRVVALAYVSGNRTGDIVRKCIHDLVFLGLICLEDSLRTDAGDAISAAQSAGIRVIIITGDNVDTASAIGRESGILKRGDKVILGEELDSMTDSEISTILPSLSVIARALPSHKLRVIKVARESGYITGMTGDGINDAPALRLSDVGFAMGDGTDVTKEASDIVITDNSISSIIKAVLFGRTIFRSIRKFIVFQLTMNLCATAVSFLAPLFGIEAPVTIIQMLWVNLIMDTLGALAFAGESPRKRYMTLPPFPADVRILTVEMVRGIVLTALYMIAMSMFFLFSPISRNIFAVFGDTYFLTAFFAFFIMCGIALSFNARTPSLSPLSGIGKNPGFIFIMTAVAVVQLALIYFGGELFRCTPLLPSHLGTVSLLALSVIPVGGFIKILQKNRYIDI